MSVFVHVCKGIFIYTCMYVKGHCECIQMWCSYTNICIHIGVCTCVCMCVHLHIYVYKDAVCVYKVCTYKYIHVCVSVLFTDEFYMCERRHRWIQIHCVRMNIHVHVSVLVRGCVCVSV